MNAVYIVAADYGASEGWQRPIGAFSTEDAAFAATGRALIGGVWCAQNLRVMALDVNGPFNAESTGPTEMKERVT